MAGLTYLPGTKAVLVYVDENGLSRSSIVEIVRETLDVGRGWYAVKARQEVFSRVFNVTQLRASNTDVEDGWAVSIVSIERLAPLGTRIFNIVQ